MAELAERWQLRLDAPYDPGGQCSWVAPARGPSGDERLHADPSGFVRRMASLLEDAARLRLWLFARCVVEAPGWPGLYQVAERLAP